jgi:hypothetical protein
MFKEILKVAATVLAIFTGFQIGRKLAVKKTL